MEIEYFVKILGMTINFKKNVQYGEEMKDEWKNEIRNDPRTQTTLKNIDNFLKTKYEWYIICT